MSSLPCFARWASSLRWAAWAGVRRGELIWRNFLRGRSYSPALSAACCVYFQAEIRKQSRWLQRDIIVTMQLCLPQTVPLWGCLRVVCTWKWWNHPDLFFCTSTDLISANIWALICSGLGRFSYKLDIMDFSAWRRVSLVTLSRGGRLPCTKLDSRGADPHVSGSYGAQVLLRACNGKVHFPPRCAPHVSSRLFMPAAFLFFVTLLVSTG